MIIFRWLAIAGKYLFEKFEGWYLMNCRTRIQLPMWKLNSIADSELLLIGASSPITLIPQVEIDHVVFHHR